MRLRITVSVLVLFSFITGFVWHTTDSRSETYISNTKITNSLHFSSDTVYFPNTIDTMPQLIVNGKAISIEEYILGEFKWSSSMNESEAILVKYLIDDMGYLRNIELHRVPHVCIDCTKEFLRVITSIPRFKPGRQKGANVSVQMALRYKFKIVR